MFHPTPMMNKAVSSLARSQVRAPLRPRPVSQLRAPEHSRDLRVALSIETVLRQSGTYGDVRALRTSTRAEDARPPSSTNVPPLGQDARSTSFDGSQQRATELERKAAEKRARTRAIVPAALASLAALSLALGISYMRMTGPVHADCTSEAGHSMSARLLLVGKARRDSHALDQLLMVKSVAQLGSL